MRFSVGGHGSRDVDMESATDGKEAERRRLQSMIDTAQEMDEQGMVLKLKKKLADLEPRSELAAAKDQATLADEKCRVLKWRAKEKQDLEDRLKKLKEKETTVEYQKQNSREKESKQKHSKK